jgi:adenosylcobinamide-GDP ribazoletransferase
MMLRELQLFFTALMFYTRIPCPAWVSHDPVDLNLATRYFPLVGWIVGIFTWLILIVCQCLFPTHVSVVLSIAGGILMTGAFHEDGLADVCDGFGGGWTKEKILLIMKDSRVGTYGVVGLILVLLIKCYAITELSSYSIYLIGLMLVTANTLSRMTAVYIIFTAPYAREHEDSKAKPIAKQMQVEDFLIAACWAILPLGLLVYYQVAFFFIIIPVLPVTIYLRRYYTKWIGGYTGDCLGATQQITEIVIYLSLLVVWKYI